MSALSKLVGKPEPWKWFTEKYPVKVKQVNPPTSFTKTIKENIFEAGDALQERTAAKCLMTKWNMHDEYKTFCMVGEEAIEVVGEFAEKIVDMKLPMRGAIIATGEEAERQQWLPQGRE